MDQRLASLLSPSPLQQQPPQGGNPVTPPRDGASQPSETTQILSRLTDMSIETRDRIQATNEGLLQTNTALLSFAQRQQLHGVEISSLREGQIVLRESVDANKNDIETNRNNIYRLRGEVHEALIALGFDIEMWEGKSFV